MIPPIANSMAQSRLKMENLSSIESPSPSSRNEILSTNGVMLVLRKEKKKKTTEDKNLMKEKSVSTPSEFKIVLQNDFICTTAKC